jgi:hypothetical protein
MQIVYYIVTLILLLRIINKKYIMKNLILIFGIIILMTNCKKESITPDRGVQLYNDKNVSISNCYMNKVNDKFCITVIGMVYSSSYNVGNLAFYYQDNWIAGYGIEYTQGKQFSISYYAKDSLTCASIHVYFYPNQISNPNNRIEIPINTL